MKELSSLEKKAHEIAVLLIKISVYVRRRELRERLERLSFSLSEYSAAKNPEVLWTTIPSLIALIHLGRTLYEIEPVNAGFVLDGLEDLQESFRKSISAFSFEEGIKAGAIGMSKQSGNRENSATKKESKPISSEKASFAVSTMSTEADNAATESGNGGENPAIRQSAIFEKMNSLSGKAIQLKDIVPLFPGVSERTLRYDLQRLSAEGKVERIGQGGPATYYKVRSL